MLITPLKPQKIKPIALLCPNYRSLTIYTTEGERFVSGPKRCYDALKRLEGHTCYVLGKLDLMTQTTGSLPWQAEVWKGRATSLSLDGTKLKVTSLRRVLEKIPTNADKFLALDEIHRTLSDQGICMGSISGMAWSLYRSTISKAYSVGFDARIGRAALYGGRQEARQDNYQNHVLLDLASAYPFSMASRPYALSLREVSKNTILDPERSGLARARVYVPTYLNFSPLPIRVADEMIQWQYGEIEGTWPWAELAAAQAIGCKVEVLRSWAPIEEGDLFSNWWANLSKLNATVSPEARPLIKAVSNSLWGLFGMTGDDRGTVRWLDDRGERPELIRKKSAKMPQMNTAHIAAETTSRVRVRMLLEGLFGNDTAPVHVDTDGIIIPETALKGRLLGDLPGQWRVKTVMKSLQVRAPQLYRYSCGEGCGVTHSSWHYVASGMTTDYAERLFENHTGLPIGIGDRDIVLPSGPKLDEVQLHAYTAEANLLESHFFGAPLV